MIKAAAVTKRVNMGDSHLTILHDIHLNIADGESVAILGVSGSGKTTLLGLLAGLDLPTTGQIYFAEQDITKLDEDGRALLRAEQVGFVFQSFQLLPSLTAIENVMMPLELQGASSPHKLAEEWLAKLGLAARLHHYPSQLSGGEQQRVAIARAFVMAPKALFADEPTGNLDKKTGATIIDLLFELNKEQGTTLVIVTHDEQLANRCDRILQLDDGRLI